MKPSIFALSALCASTVSAQPIFSMTAQLESGEMFSYSVDGDDVVARGNSYFWELEAPVEQMDSQGNLAFTLRGASISVSSDLGRSGSQSVVATFDVLAGFQNTTFTVDSALATFSTLSPALGRAEAAVTVTPAGAPATIAPMNGSIFGAYINGTAATGDNFAGLLSSPATSGSFTGLDLTESTGAAFSPIAAPVSSISSRFSFGLSAFALATGTGEFEVIPAPASAALVAAGGVLAAPRRRA